MAKQHVSTVERHLEKGILGIAGAIFLAVVVSYVIMEPNTVDYGSAALGPSDLYDQIRADAQRKLEEIRRKQPVDDPDAEPPIPTNPEAELRPSTTDTKLKTAYEVAFVPPALPVPEVSGSITGRNLTLARILPMRTPIPTQGKAMADFPAPEPVPVSGNVNTQDRSRDTGLGFSSAKEFRWVTLWTFLNREAQREAFEKAKYSVNSQKVVVADVEVQRQELLPEGGWSEPQRIRPYHPEPIVGMRAEAPVIEESGAPTLAEEDMNHIRNLRGMLEGREGQQAVLRPDFQAFLGEQQAWRWQPPEALTDSEDLVWETYGVQMYNLTEEAINGRKGPALSGMPADRERYKEAQELIGDEEFLEAYKILEGLASNRDSVRMAIQAEDLMNEIGPKAERQFKRLQQQQERAAAEAEIYHGEDVDPVWINDITVEPGKTYRYRVRPVLLNSYAGAPIDMKNAEDGGKILVRGEWSAWSSDIQVQPATQMFFRSADAGQRTATVEMFRWVTGEWKRASGPFGIGSRITLDRSGDVFRYDGIVSDLEFERPFSVREEGARTVSYRETQTPVLTLVSSAGTVEERLAEQDMYERRQFNDQKEREEAIQRVLASEDRQRLIKEPPAGVDAPRFGGMPAGGGFGQPGFGPAPGGRDRLDRGDRRRRPPRGGPPAPPRSGGGAPAS